MFCGGDGSALSGPSSVVVMSARSASMSPPRLTRSANKPTQPCANLQKVARDEKTAAILLIFVISSLGYELQARSFLNPRKKLCAFSNSAIVSPGGGLGPCAFKELSGQFALPLRYARAWDKRPTRSPSSDLKIR